VMAVVAIVHKSSGSRDILWFHTSRFGGAIFGPFTNPNHYAAYMNMAFGLALGLLLAASQWSRPASRSAWRKVWAWFAAPHSDRVVLVGFMSGMMGASVFVSLSRGGAISLVASLGIAGTFVALRDRQGLGRVIAAAAVLVVAIVVWLGWEPVVGELSTLGALDPKADSRVVAAWDTLRIFRRAPVAGCGFGSFQYVFGGFQSPDIQFGRWLHAHNDYAQLLAEGGVVGALLWLGAVVAFLVHLRVRLRPAAADGEAEQAGYAGSPVPATARCMLGGIAVGLGTIALHSLFDYGLHKPANAFLLAGLCGMAVAVAHLRSTRHRPGMRRERSDELGEATEEAAIQTCGTR
jgi:O-antigen ligase